MTAEQTVTRWLTFTLPIALLPTVVVLFIYLVRGPIVSGQAIHFDLGDLVVYFGSSSWIAGGGALYRETLSEYPLAANLIFAGVRLVSLAVPRLHPFTAFAIVWLALAAVTLAALLRSMLRNRFPPMAFWAPLGPATIYFGLLRYDIFPAAACYFCLLDLRAGKWARASLWLGLCLALKGYALFLLPAYAVYLAGRYSVRTAASGMALVLLPFVVSHLAVLGWAGVEGVLLPYRFQLNRDFNGESLYDSLAFFMSGAGVSATGIASFRNAILDGPFPKLAAIATAILAAGMRPASFDELVDAWLFAVLGFILSSIFISPQWLLWVLPIAAFSVEPLVHRLTTALAYATFVCHPVMAGLGPLGAVTGQLLSIALVNVFRVALVVEIAIRFLMHPRPAANLPLSSRIPV